MVYLDFEPPRLGVGSEADVEELDSWLTAADPRSGQSWPDADKRKALTVKEVVRLSFRPDRLVSELRACRAAAFSIEQLRIPQSPSFPAPNARTSHEEKFPPSRSSPHRALRLLGLRFARLEPEANGANRRGQAPSDRDKSSAFCSGNGDPTEDQTEDQT